MQLLFKKCNEKLFLNCFLIIISILFFCSNYAACFSFVAFLFLFLYLFFLNITNKVIVLCFFHGFEKLLIINVGSFQINFFDILYAFAFFIIGIFYLIELTKDKKKINPLIFTTLCLILIFILLFPKFNFSFIKYSSYAVLFVSIYLIAQYKDRINLKEVGNYLAYGLIVSCLIGFVFEFNQYINNLNCFGGLFLNRNHLSFSIIISISLLFLIDFKEMISPKKCFMISLLFAFGLMTSSRVFVICFVVSFLTYFIIKIIKYKRKKILNLACLLICFVFVCLFLSSSLQYVFDRIFSSSSNVDIENVFSKIDIGRFNLLKLYLNDFVSSLQSFLFGRGYNAELLGDLTSHNSYAQTLWMFGLVGTSLMAVYYILLVVNKGIFKSKENILVLILFLPFVCISCVEVVFFGFNFFVLIMSLLVFFEKNKIVKEKVDNSKKISIIVPVYNVEKYLEDCLFSLKNQTYKNIEVILIDDGSTDNSKKICEKFAKDDKRIVLIHKKNGGVSSARNEGLKHVSGDIVQFVDADDYLEQDCCNLIAKNMEENDLILFSNRDSNGKTFVFDDCKYINQNDIIKLFSKIVHTWQMGLLWNKAYKAELLKDLKFNENILIQEDLYFNLQVFRRVKSIATINDVLYNYRLSQNSLSRSNKTIKIEQLIDIYNEFDSLNKNAFNNNQKFLQHYNGYFLKSLVNLFKGDLYKENELLRILESKEIKTALVNYQTRSIKEEMFVWLIKHKKIKLIKKMI